MLRVITFVGVKQCEEMCVHAYIVYVSTLVCRVEGGSVKVKATMCS